MWAHARHPLLGGGLVGHAADGAADRSAGSSGPGPERPACTRTRPSRFAVVLSCFRLEPPGTGSSTSRASFRLCAYLLQPSRGRSSEVVPAWTPCSRRSTSGRCSSRSATCSSRRPMLQDVDGTSSGVCGGRRARPARRVPVGGRRSRSRPSSPASPSRRRLGQVALRRPGAGWLYVRPDLIDAARADIRRLAGARQAVRIRAELGTQRGSRAS